jgi:hypothetical protein
MLAFMQRGLQLLAADLWAMACRCRRLNPPLLPTPRCADCSEGSVDLGSLGRASAVCSALDVDPEVRMLAA